MYLIQGSVEEIAREIKLVQTNLRKRKKEKKRCDPICYSAQKNR